MFSLKEMMSTLSFKIQLRHKLVIIICLSLSIYTLISSETLSLLIGYNRSYNSSNNNNNYYNNERKRGIRTNDSNGNLLFYHLPNLSDYNILSYYKELSDGNLCFTYGTDWNQTHSHNLCKCIDGYFGTDCGIPSIVYNSQFKQFKDVVIKRLSKPKRIVLSVILFPTHDLKAFVHYINNTFKLLSDLIDLFIIIEIKLIQTNNSSSNVQIFNQSLSLNSISVNMSANHSKKSANNNNISDENSYQLKDIDLKKSLKQYSDILIFKSIKVSSKQYMKMGANRLQSYALSKLWTTSVKNVTEFRPNDILIYMTCNWFPLKEIVMFLKHYSGFAQPIKFITSLPQNYSNNELLKTNSFCSPVLANNYDNNLVNTGLTFEYLSLLCRYDFDLFKQNQCISDEIHVKKFIDTYGPIRFWTIGNHSLKSSATYVCTQCLIPFD